MFTTLMIVFSAALSSTAKNTCEPFLVEVCFIVLVLMCRSYTSVNFVTVVFKSTY